MKTEHKNFILAFKNCKTAYYNANTNINNYNNYNNNFKKIIMDNKRKCIANFLLLDLAEVKPQQWDHWGLEVYNGYAQNYNGTNAIAYWAVGTDEQVKKAIEKYMLIAFWTFDSEFLAKQTKLPIETFKELEKEHEKANDLITKLIQKTCGIESFIDATIKEEGRGVFLALADGYERKKTFKDEKSNDQVLYFYRID